MQAFIIRLAIIIATVLLSSCGGSGTCSSCSTQTVYLDPNGGGISDGQVNVSTSPIIKLKFTTTMDPTTINQTSILLSTVALNDSPAKTPTADGTDGLIAITSPTTSDNQTFSFSPLSVLSDNSKYYITVTDGAKTMAGVAVSGNFSFTTGDNTSPTVSLETPVNGSGGVSLSPSIVLLFSESVNGVSTTNVSLHASSSSGGVVNIASITASSGNQYVLNLAESLVSNTTYYLVLESGISDTANPVNYLQSTIFNFTTGDYIKPQVTLLNPLNNATGVAIASMINLQFSESVQNVTTSSLNLHSGSPSGPIIPTTLITNANLQNYSLQPLSNLDYLTTYYVTADDTIHDLSGNLLDNTVFNFTTEVLALGNLALVSTTNSVQLGGQITARVELQNSSGIYTSLPITITHNNSNIGITIPSGCNLTTVNNSCQILLSGEYLGNSVLSASTTTSGYSPVSDLYNVSGFGNGSYFDYALMNISYPNIIVNRCLVESNGVVSQTCLDYTLAGSGGGGYSYSMAIFNPLPESDAYIYLPSRLPNFSNIIQKCALDNNGQVIPASCSNAFPSGVNFSGNSMVGGFVSQIINGQSYLYFYTDANGLVGRCEMTESGNLVNCLNSINLALPSGLNVATQVTMWNVESDKLYLYLASVYDNASITRCEISTSTGLGGACSTVLNNLVVVPDSMAFMTINNQLYLYFSSFDNINGEGIIKVCPVNTDGSLAACSNTNVVKPKTSQDGDRTEIFSLTPVVQGKSLYMYATYFEQNGYGMPTTNAQLMSCLINSPTNLSCNDQHTYSGGGQPLGIYSFSFY